MSDKSTMKVTEHVLVTERKRHPNDVRYPCRGSHEIMDAGRKLITFLSNDNPNSLELLKKGQLIVDEDETAELYDSFQVEDVIGLGIFRPTGHPNSGFSSNMYIVEKIHEGSDYMDCRNVRTQEIEEISFQDVSIALALGLAEILYRDDKPFGISNDIEWKISIREEDTTEADATANATTPAATTPGVTASNEDEVEETEDTQSSGDMFGDLGVPALSAPVNEVLPTADEARAALVEKLNPKFWSKRQKLSHLQVEKLKEGDVVWVHATTDLGQVMKKGPLVLLSKEENLYTFTDALGEEHQIDIIDEWDDYSEHFMSNGGFYMLFEARDSRPKPESEASANDDTGKLIKALGLDKKAEENAKKAEQEEKEKPLRWPDCYFAFGWIDETFSVLLCPKKHWDEHKTLVEDGTKVKQLADQLGLTEVAPGVFDYSSNYNETTLRMLFKSFSCQENTDMVDNQ